MLDGEYIGFTAEPYKTLDGRETILLDSKRESMLLPVGDRWLLRPETAQAESNPKIDSRVIIFEKPTTKETHYVQIRARQPIRQQKLRPFERITLTEMQPSNT